MSQIMYVNGSTMNEKWNEWLEDQKIERLEIGRSEACTHTITSKVYCLATEDSISSLFNSTHLQVHYRSPFSHTNDHAVKH